MRLLVSVRDVHEAMDAIGGGADVIDVKEPSRGALGAADPLVARAIARYVDARKPVSIVLGDVTDACEAVALAAVAGESGASMIKVGLGGVASIARACTLVRAVSSQVVSAATVVVAYGDPQRARSLPVERILELAFNEGARGLVLDTFDKTGPPLPALVRRARLERLVDDAHAAGLFVGVAGKLGQEHVREMSDLGVDLFGVRGAVCTTSDRRTRLVSERVGALARLLRECDGAQLTAQSA